MISSHKTGCLYKFGQVSQQAPPMYIQNNQLISVATGNKLPIVLSKTGSPPSGECMIHKVEVDTGDGWTPVSLNGIKLEVVGGATYLNVSWIQNTLIACIIIIMYRQYNGNCY